MRYRVTGVSATDKQRSASGAVITSVSGAAAGLGTGKYEQVQHQSAVSMQTCSSQHARHADMWAM